jgi:phytoene synthase
VGRIYLPGAWLREAGVPEAEIADPKHRPGILAVARRLLAVSEPYYASAISGLPALGFRSAWAVAAARGVYRAIGFEVLKRGEHAWDERVSTSTATKAWLALGGGVKALVSRFGVAGERADLWSKI